MMFAFQVVVFYTTTIGEHTWNGSNVNTAPTMYIRAVDEENARQLIYMSGLIPTVGDKWSARLGDTVVTQINLNIIPARDVAVAPF